MVIAFLPLSYLAAASGARLLDSDLTRLDALLFGFDWDTAARWVANHPTLDHVLRAAYSSMVYQVVAVLLIGSLARPGDRNGEFIWSCAVGCILTCAIFVFTPALGKVGHIGTAQVETLTMIRNGPWTVFDYERATGLINFPSFHTTLAILFSYAVRRHRWALAIFIPLDALLIASTPTVGGHYLVDLPAGAAVAIASIVSARAIRRRVAPKLAGSAFAQEL